MPSVRRIAWLLAAAFVLLWFAFSWLPHTAAALTWPQTALFGLVAVLSVAGCLAAAFVTTHLERAGWVLMGTGAFLMASGDLMAAITGGPLRQPMYHSVSVPGILWLVAYLPYMLAFSFFVQPDLASGADKLRRGIDLVLMVLLVSLVIFTGILFPLYGSGAGRSLIPALPALISLAISIGLLLHIASTRPKVYPWQVPLVAALLVVVGGSVFGAFGSGLAASWSAVAGISEAPWFMGYVFVGVAGLERVRHKGGAPRNCLVALNAPNPGWGISLTALFFVLLPLFVLADAMWVGDADGDLMFSIIISVGAVAAIARNLVIAVENSQLQQRSTTDALTGLANHRYFIERLEAEFSRATRTTNSLSLVAMDVDDFDQVNNVYGHAAGDRRLRSIADRLTKAARGSDIVCRVGGDEFVIVMPDTGPLEAYKVCMRLRDQLNEPDDVCPLPITLSIGIASLPEHAHTIDELIQRADGAQYWAKFHGREQVVIYDSGIVRALGPDQRVAQLEEESYLNMVQLLSSAVDARDPYTQRHSRRVAELAVALASHLGFNESQVSSLETAALLHDVGKIGVPDDILRKPVGLDPDEYALVQQHPILATRILGATPHPEILPWIAAHHERWDGAGYPDGLAGEQIPLQSRIMSLCDSFDAMTSDRPYRPALSTSEARALIEAGAGIQFDPMLTQQFISLLDARELARAGSRGPRRAFDSTAATRPQSATAG